MASSDGMFDYASRCERCGGLIVPVPSPFWGRVWFHWPFPRGHAAVSDEK